MLKIAYVLNIELPAGEVESIDREFTVRVARTYLTPEHFERLTIKRGDNGQLVRLAEVARIEMGPRTIKLTSAVTASTWWVSGL